MICVRAHLLRYPAVVSIIGRRGRTSPAWWRPSIIWRKLGDKGIFVWHGNYYALAVSEKLGVENSGGMVRVGLAHYNTREEVDRFLSVIEY